MRILVCGGRNYTNRLRIQNFIMDLPRDTVVIHGGARGADYLAGHYAKQYHLEVLVYPAKWVKLARAAGYIRNQQMLDESKPDIVVYYHDDLLSSKGTADMVRRARDAGLRVVGNPQSRKELEV